MLFAALINLHKETTEALLCDNASAVFYLVLPECGSHKGQTDLVQKSLADEREVYMGTPSEETRIK